MFRIAATLAALGIGASTFLAPAPAAAYTMTATVVKVVDGDTLDVRYDDGREDTVRVLGIDTPETEHPNIPVECWGPEASAFASNELAGRRVSLSTDPAQDERDRYKRLLAFVDRDGWNYSIEAARAGAARAYIFEDKPVTLYPQIAAAESEARNAGRGLWGPPCNGQR